MPFPDRILDADYVKISLISTFYFFLVFNHDFIIYIDFARISVANTAFYFLGHNVVDSFRIKMQQLKERCRVQPESIISGG